MNRRRAAIASILWLAAAAACGGGDRTPSSPTSPTPALPPSSACGALGGNLIGVMPILNGADCPTTSSAVVLLNMRAADGFAAGACSGTIIAPRSVLTAAHCLDGEVATVTVWLGSGDLIPVSSFIPHPQYTGSAASPDVGIVRVDQDLGRAPMPLLLSRDARVGEEAIIAGWGRDQNNVTAMHRAGVTTISAVGPLTLQTQFSATSSSICSGDSGGPILLSQGGAWAIAGVSSATSENVCNTGTNFYISVRNSAVMSFILQHVPDAARR